MVKHRASILEKILSVFSHKIDISNFELVKKRYLLVLQIGVAITSVLLAILVIADDRLNIVGEPYIDHMQAMSIAISRIVYGVEGLVGFEQVFDILMQVPNVSAIHLDSALAYENYQFAINDALHNATLLTGLDQNQIHAYTNDQSYLHYVIMAFWLFGVKVQSLSYLWLLLLCVSIVSFLISYNKRIPNLLLLWCTLVSIVLVVISNPGVGKQLITVHNYRFMPILGLIPLLHIIFSLYSEKKALVDWSLILVQGLMLVFVLLVRGSAQWMLIAMGFLGFYFFWCYRKKLRTEAQASPILLYGFFALRMTPVLLTFTCFLLAKSALPKLLHEEYSEELWAPSHVIWHGSVVGLTIDPVLMGKYVCSDKLLTDRLKGFRQIICDQPPRPNRRLVDGIRASISDMHGYQAAVKYLREQGSDEQIGSETLNSRYFHIRWARYDEIVGKVYLEMIKNDPLDLLYMYAIVIPIRYIIEAAMYTVYFTKSLIESESSVGILGVLAIVFSLHLYLIRECRYLFVHMPKDLQDEIKILPIMSLIVFVASLAPSIIFYSQPHTIPDSVAVFLTLVLALSMTHRLRDFWSIKPG